MSHENRAPFSEPENVSGEDQAADDQLQIGLRLGLEEVAAAEEEKLRKAPPKRPTQAQLTRLAFEIYRARLARWKIMDEGLLGEPAWDMLLALYCLPSRGEVLSVTSLSMAANVPQATGIRWQNKLLEEGLIKRGPHVRDQRVQLIGLSPRGRMLMDKYMIRLFYCQGGARNLLP